MALYRGTIQVSGGGATYSAGANVQINNGVISATDTTYTAGANINIDANNVISATGGGTTYTAGTGIDITSDVISTDGTVIRYPDYNWVNKTGATITLDLDSTITPSSNFTVNVPSSIKDGQEYVLRVDNGATAYTMTLGSNITNPYSVDLTLTANGIDQFSFLAVNGVLELQPEIIRYTASDFDIKDLADSTGLRTAWSGKQDELIASTNIQIAADGKTISATDTTYTAGTGINIDANNVISATGGGGSSYTAGDNIDITSDVISAKNVIVTDAINSTGFTIEDNSDNFMDVGVSNVYQITMGNEQDDHQGNLDYADVNLVGNTGTIGGHIFHDTPSSQDERDYYITPEGVEVTRRITSGGTTTTTTENYYWIDNGLGSTDEKIAKLGDIAKVFYLPNDLTSASALSIAQDAYDWFNAGKTPIIVYKGKTCTVAYSTASGLAFRNARTLIDNTTYSSSGCTAIIQYEVYFTISSGTVTSIIKSEPESYFIDTTTQYTNPFSPTQNYHPATKKYVDDSISGIVIPTYSAGTGLTLNGTTFNVDTTTIATKADIANLSSFEVVASLPSVSSADSHTIYLLGPIGTGADKYEEWIVTDSIDTETKTFTSTIFTTSYTPNTLSLSKNTIFTYLSHTAPVGGSRDILFTDSVTGNIYKYQLDGWYFQDVAGGSSTFVFVNESTITLPTGTYSVSKTSMQRGFTSISFTASTSTPVKTWTKIGETSIDLSGYATTSDLNTKQDVLTAGDGIDIDANDEISVDVTDIIGTGLSEDASNNITIDTTVVATHTDLADYIPYVGGQDTPIALSERQLYKATWVDVPNNTNASMALRGDGIRVDNNANNIASSARIDVYPDKAEVYIKEFDTQQNISKEVDIYAGEMVSNYSTDAGQTRNTETYEFQGGGNNQIARLKNIPSYSAGTGLTLNGTTFNVDTTTIATKSDIANLGSFTVVATLPSVSSADEKTIYLLGPIGTGADKYEEWIVTETTGTKSFTGDGQYYTPGGFELTSDTTFVYDSSTGSGDIFISDGVGYIAKFTSTGRYLFDSNISDYVFVDATTIDIPAGIYPNIGPSTATYDSITFDTSSKVWTKIGETSVDLSNYLAKNNTTSYTPSGDYNPATKKYVDDNKGIANDTTGTTTTVTKLWAGTQAEYTNLTTKDANTVYIVF